MAKKRITEVPRDGSEVDFIPQNFMLIDGAEGSAKMRMDLFAKASSVEDLQTGKADKVSNATAGNFAGLDSNGNLTDSGKKESDFATVAQGSKADTAIQEVKVNGSALTPDANKAVDVTVPVAGSSVPFMDGTASVGSSAKFAREDHVHPTDTSREPAFSILPVTKGGTGSGTASGARINLDVYSKSETDTLLNGKVVIVSTLPSTGESGKIYYVGPIGTGVDKYEEYLWNTDNAQFIKVGERSIDLSGYKTKQTAVPSPFAQGYSTSFISDVSQDTNGKVTLSKKTVMYASNQVEGIIRASDYKTWNDAETTYVSADAETSFVLDSSIKKQNVIIYAPYVTSLLLDHSYIDQFDAQCFINIQVVGYKCAKLILYNKETSTAPDGTSVWSYKIAYSDTLAAQRSLQLYNGGEQVALVNESGQSKALHIVIGKNYSSSEGATLLTLINCTSSSFKS